MASPLVLLTGFEPFLDVAENPSGAVALALAAEPPEGVEVAGGVLPVSLERLPGAYDALLADLEPRRPDLLLATGVHRGPQFRLERFAHARLHSDQFDNDGRPVAGVTVGDGIDRRTPLDLDALEERFCGEDEVARRNWNGFMPRNVERVWQELAGELDA